MRLGRSLPRRRTVSCSWPLGAMLALSGLAGFVPACGSDTSRDGEHVGSVVAELTQAQRMDRYAMIRTAALGRGVNGTAYLLAGIAYAETGLAHCWSEATWACEGPNSPDCGGGPVIAGSGDGACSLQQGGLGMFQFDAGTYSQTLATYGDDVLTVAGNVSHAIDFVVRIVRDSAYTTNAETDAKALQWIVDFDYYNATLRDQWIKTVTHYYNGCAPSYSCWSQRYAHYNDSLSFVVDETGLDFWKVVVNAPPTGYLDGATCDRIWGWAQDPDAAAAPIDVHLYFNGAPGDATAVGVPVPANVHRDDLCTSLGSCEHAFESRTPLSLLDGQDHPVRAYGIDSAGGANAELAQSPVTLSCAMPLPAGFKRHVPSQTVMATWKFDAFWDVVPVTDAQLGSFENADDLPAALELVLADDGSPEVWLIDGDWRRHVPSPEIAAAWRFDLASATTAPAAEVYAHPQGHDVRARPILVQGPGPEVYLLDDKDEAPAPDAGADSGADDGGTTWPDGAAGTGGNPGTGGSANAATSPVHGDTAQTSACAVSTVPASSTAPWILLLSLSGAVGYLARRARRRGLSR